MSFMEGMEVIEKVLKEVDKSKYASERYDPTLPYCAGKIELRFDGKKLKLSGIMNRTIPFTAEFNAVSGLPDKNNNFDYSVESQKKKDRGPIPNGKYWVRPDEFWENAFYKLWAPDGSWGNYRITLHPFKSTETYGRGGFFIHGGSTPGSKGCVDLTGEMDGFFNTVQTLIEDNSHCHIELIVAYAGAGIMRDGTVLRRHILK